MVRFEPDSRSSKPGQAVIKLSIRIPGLPAQLGRLRCVDSTASGLPGCMSLRSGRPERGKVAGVGVEGDFPNELPSRPGLIVHFADWRVE